MPEHFCCFTLWPFLYRQLPILPTQRALRGTTVLRVCNHSFIPPLLTAPPRYLQQGSRGPFPWDTEAVPTAEGWLVATGAAVGGYGGADQDGVPAVASHKPTAGQPHGPGTPAKVGWLQQTGRSPLPSNLSIPPVPKMAYATALQATQPVGNYRTLLGIHLSKPKFVFQMIAKPLSS